jgi:hypothetical protein
LPFKFGNSEAFSYPVQRSKRRNVPPHLSRHWTDVDHTVQPSLLAFSRKPRIASSFELSPSSNFSLGQLSPH